MGIFDKLKQKVLGAVEKSAVSQMSEEDKAKYEAEQAAKKPKQVGEELVLKFTSEETKDLEALLTKLGALDTRKIWIGGFSKTRSNTNAKFANMSSVYKNLRFLTVNNGVFYMVHFVEDTIKSYKAFSKENVASVERKPIFALKLFDKTMMNLELTQNKQKVHELIDLLKAK